MVRQSEVITHVPWVRQSGGINPDHCVRLSGVINPVHCLRQSGVINPDHCLRQYGPLSVIVSHAQCPICPIGCTVCANEHTHLDLWNTEGNIEVYICI